MTSPHEDTARARKARKILAVIDAASGHLVSSAGLAGMDDADWRNAALVAGCKPASTTTRALIADWVTERETRLAGLVGS